jgi:hypothetical protein
MPFGRYSANGSETLSSYRKNRHGLSTIREEIFPLFRSNPSAGVIAEQT